MLSRDTKSSILAGLIAVGFLVATAGPARAAFDNVYSAGHADINIGYNAAARALSLNYELASNAVVNGQVLGSAGAGDVGADTLSVFLGANSLGTGLPGLPAPFVGNPLYTIPQTSTAGRPFLGIGAEAIDQGLFRGESLTLTLTGFARRPAGGEFILWQRGAETSPFINSADGLTGADQVGIVTGGHDHYTLGFTALGTYDLNFTATGTLLDGTALSVTSTYRFQVGPAASGAVPEPASLALLGCGIVPAGLVLVRRRPARARRIA